MGMFMNRKEKQIYEKIANLTDEEKAKEMLSKIKGHKPFDIRKHLHKIGIHCFPHRPVDCDDNTNSRILKCKICGDLFRRRLNLDRKSYFNATLIVTLFTFGSIFAPEPILCFISIPCFSIASDWIAKIAGESIT